MRAVVQRVLRCEVSSGGKTVGSCGPGICVLLGVAEGDDERTSQRLWAKVRDLRIFPDDAGRTNLSLADVGGEACIVSQFTLLADVRHGRRPSFTAAAEPKMARRLYELFCELAEQDVAHVGRGAFGEHLEVSLVGDGPFTIVIDTDELPVPKA